MSLTPRQARFVDEYLVDLNGTQAAIRAGYARSGARTEAARALANPNIRTIIQEKQAETALRLEVTRETVILGLLEAVELAREHRIYANKKQLPSRSGVPRPKGYYPEHISQVFGAFRRVATQVLPLGGQKRQGSPHVRRRD